MEDSYIPYGELESHMKKEQRRKRYEKFKSGAAKFGRGLKSATIKTVHVSGKVAKGIGKATVKTATIGSKVISNTSRYAGNVGKSFNQAFPQQITPQRPMRIKRRTKNRMIKQTPRRIDNDGEPLFTGGIQ